MDDLLLTLRSASLEQKATLRARLLGSVAATDPDDELSTLMSKAGDPLAAYNLFLAHSKKVYQRGRSASAEPRTPKAPRAPLKK